MVTTLVTDEEPHPRHACTRHDRETEPPLYLLLKEDRTGFFFIVIQGLDLGPDLRHGLNDIGVHSLRSK